MSLFGGIYCFLEPQTPRPPPIQMNPLMLALRLSIIGLSLGYLDDDMTEDGQLHQPQAVEKLGGTKRLPCTCQHYHQPSWSNILDTCARAHSTLSTQGLVLRVWSPDGSMPQLLCGPSPWESPTSSTASPRPCPEGPYPNSHSGSSHSHSQTTTGNTNPTAPCSCTSVYPSMLTQCYDLREVTVGHSKGKKPMTGSIEPTLFWGYRDPRCPDERGPTC